MLIFAFWGLKKRRICLFCYGRISPLDVPMYAFGFDSPILNIFSYFQIQLCFSIETAGA